MIYFVKIINISILLIFCVTFKTYAQSILIFSTSHDNFAPTLVQEAEGSLTIEVSTFQPMVKILVNGEAIALQRPIRARLIIPYTLEAGANPFTVQVKTEQAEHTKTFVLNLAESTKKKVKEKKPLQVIVLAGVNNSDNVNSSVDSDKESGMKGLITVIPRYQFPLSPLSDLVFHSIVLREYYTNSNLGAASIAYTLAAVDWIQKGTKDQEWTVGLGWSEVGTEVQGLEAKTQVENNLFLSGAFQQKLEETSLLNVRLRYTMKDVKIVPDPAHDGDGNFYQTDVAWSSQKDKIKWRVKLGYDLNDAKGRYQDFTASKGGVTIGYPYTSNLGIAFVGNVIGINFSGNVKQTTFSENDPLKGAQEVSTLSQWNLKFNFSLPSSIQLQTSLQQKTQVSNIKTREYTENSVSLIGVYLY